MKALHAIAGQWKYVVRVVVYVLFSCLSIHPSIVVVVVAVVCRVYAIGQANEAIFITSFAAESIINFQFSECHLAWLTDIINRKCTKIPPINSISHESKMYAHTFLVTFFLVSPSLSYMIIVFVLSRFSGLAFSSSYMYVLCALCFGHYYAINHPFVGYVRFIFFLAEAGEQLIWQIQWKCHPQCSGILISQVTLILVNERRREWHLFLMNTSGTWILWPCQRPHKNIPQTTKLFSLLFVDTQTHTTNTPAYRTTSNFLNQKSIWFVLCPCGGISLEMYCALYRWEVK